MKDIFIHVRGGNVFQVVGPKGCNVQIVDYDNLESADADERLKIQKKAEDSVRVVNNKLAEILY